MKKIFLFIFLITITIATTNGNETLPPTSSNDNTTTDNSQDNPTKATNLSPSELDSEKELLPINSTDNNENVMKIDEKPIIATTPPTTTTTISIQEELIPPADVNATIANMGESPKKKNQIIIR